jgi:hypothetical protein
VRGNGNVIEDSANVVTISKQSITEIP